MTPEIAHCKNANSKSCRFILIEDKMSKEKQRKSFYCILQLFYNSYRVQFKIELPQKIIIH